MDSAFADIPVIHPQPADEEVRQALMELDAKLAAWASAVRELQARMARAADGEIRSPSAASGSREDAPAASSAQTQAAARRQPEPVEDQISSLESYAGTPAAVAPTPVVAVADQAGLEPEPAPVPPAVKASVDGDTRSKARPHADEDEALLASLDEQTAAAIRVMRRLNPSGKSVRELLAQYQATHPRTEVKRSRKVSWFSRGK